MSQVEGQTIMADMDPYLAAVDEAVSAGAGPKPPKVRKPVKEASKPTAPYRAPSISPGRALLEAKRAAAETMSTPAFGSQSAPSAARRMPDEAKNTPLPHRRCQHPRVKWQFVPVDKGKAIRGPLGDAERFAPVPSVGFGNTGCGSDDSPRRSCSFSDWFLSHGCCTKPAQAPLVNVVHCGSERVGDVADEPPCTVQFDVRWSHACPAQNDDVCQYDFWRRPFHCTALAALGEFRVRFRDSGASLVAFSAALFLRFT